MDLQKIAEKVKNRGYAVRVVANAEEGREYLYTQIQGVSVGFGGSVTVGEMGLYPRLKERNTVYWHGDKEALERYGNVALRKMASEAEVYVCSVNGMTEEGVLINIDYTGNRIAATCFGPKKVYLVIGKNKIAPDFESALWRARNVAAPKNAQRLGRKTPCAVKGDKCYDCNSPDRICNGFLVFEREMKGTQTEVILIDEELGY